MLRPDDWEQTSSYSNTPALPVGGYVCDIIKVEEKQSKSTGRNVLHVQIDIAEGEYFQYYAKQFTRNNAPDKKWRGMVYVATQDKDGKTLPNFKGFIESIEESNDGWSPAWNQDTNIFCESFKNRKIGIVFGREQFKSDRNDKLYWQTKPKYFHSIDEIRSGDFNIPDDKPIEDPEKQERMNNVAQAAGFTAIEDDEKIELPF